MNDVERSEAERPFQKKACFVGCCPCHGKLALASYAARIRDKKLFSATGLVCCCC